MRRNVIIDDMQFGFMPGRGTTDAIFIVRQLQERYLEKKRELWMAFVDLEKAFDRVPRESTMVGVARSGSGRAHNKLYQSHVCRSDNLS